MASTALPENVTKRSAPRRRRLRGVLRRLLAWSCVIVLSVIAFFAAWLVYQHRPIRQMRAALSERKFADGLRLALAYIAEHPQDAEAWKLAARCYAGMGQHGAVEQCLARAGDLDIPDLRLRADALIQLEHNTQAVEVLKELLEREGIDPAVLRRLAILQFRRNAHDEAFAYAKRLSEFPEHAPSAWYIQATFNTVLHRYDDAIRCLEKVLEINPELDRCGLPRGTVLWYIGTAMQDIGKMREAREYFHMALKHEQTADIYWSLGVSDEACGDPVAAEEAWRRTLEIVPKHRDALFSLAKLALKQNRPEEAIHWLELLRSVSKESAAIETAFARAYARLGREDLAHEHAQRAESLQAEAQARGLEERQMMEYPDHLHSRMLMTQRAIDSGNIGEATALVEEALRQHPDNQLLLQLRDALLENK